MRLTLKVNISYAVELEDVPSEVEKLVDRCEQSLRALHADFDMISLQNPLDFLSKIEDIRQDLSDLDIRLADCSRIVSGFLEIKSQLANRDVQASSQEEESEQ